MTRTLEVSLVALGVVAMLAGTARIAGAQTPTEQTPTQTPPTQNETGWGFLMSSGAFVPTGTQRGALELAELTAAQVSYVVSPAFAVSGTFGWARSRDMALPGDARLDVFTYDLGAEVRAPRWRANRRVNFGFFAGGGAGARSYNHRDLDIDATHTVAAYVSAGGEFGLGPVRLRVDVRDYMTGFKALGGGRATDTRNDIVVMTGVRIVKW